MTDSWFGNSCFGLLVQGNVQIFKCFYFYFIFNLLNRFALLPMYKRNVKYCVCVSESVYSPDPNNNVIIPQWPCSIHTLITMEIREREREREREGGGSQRVSLGSE